MDRGEQGRSEITTVAGERVEASIPDPLPPAPPLRIDGPLLLLLQAATHALGRLDAVSTLLPETALFLYSYVRKEAVLSSQIEGMQSSLSDLLLFELEEAPGVPLDDVKEVAGYVSALDHGVEQLRGGFPICNRLIREMHEKLLGRGRGSEKAPGEFRRSQNWIGGTRPSNAVFVPPPHTALDDCMAALEKFLNRSPEEDGIPPLVRAGLAHVQFEMIHPFLDGNGRVGRLLIALLLCRDRLLREPLLYLSLHLKQHRSLYYDLLDRTRRTGDWERWLTFFLEGVRTTAENAVRTAESLTDLLRADRERIEQRGGRRRRSARRVHEALQQRPILTITEASRLTALSFPGASSGMTFLEELAIVREITGHGRNRVYVYRRYLELLGEAGD